MGDVDIAAVLRGVRRMAPRTPLARNNAARHRGALPAARQPRRALKGQSALGEQLTLVDLVPDEDALPDDVVVAREGPAHLHAAMAQLPPREQFAIRATWFSGMKLQELADVLGVSASRMSQLRSGAIERLGELISEEAA